MAADDVVFHIIPSFDPHYWVVTIKGCARFRKEYPTKEEALNAAEALAFERAPSRVRLYTHNGIVEYDRTFTGEL